MKPNLQAHPNHWRLPTAIAATILILFATSAFLFFASRHPASAGHVPSFELAWQRSAQESTERFHAEVARIGSQKDSSNERRQSAMTVAQERHIAEMDAINSARTKAVHTFQRNAILKPVVILALLATGAAGVLWIFFRRSRIPIWIPHH